MRVITIFGFLSLLSCQSGPRSQTDGQLTAPLSDLVIETLQSGSGESIRSGDTAVIEEQMSYSSGQIIFSTEELGHAILFTVGAGQVIEGIDKGIRGRRRERSGDW